MFKGFGSAARPKVADDEPKNWEEFFAEPNTEKYIQEQKRRRAEYVKQREDSNSQPPSAQAASTSSSYNAHYNGVRAHSPIVPPNTATCDGDNTDEFSSTCGSHFGSPVDDMTTNLKTTVSGSNVAGFGAKPTSDGVFAPRQVSEFGAQSATGFTSSFSARPTTSPPGASRMFQSAIASTLRPAPPNPYDGFGVYKAPAEKDTTVAASSSSHECATLKSTVSPPNEKATVAAPQVSAFSGFGTFKSTVSPSSEQTTVTAPPPASNSFAGFGTFKNTAAPSPAQVLSGFTTFKSTVSPSSEKTTVSAELPANNAFASFGILKNTAAPSPAQAPSGFTTFKSNVSPPNSRITVAAPQAIDRFTGFGTFKNTVAPPPSQAPSSFTIFNSTVPPSGEKTTVTAASPANNAFASFGIYKPAVSLDVSTSGATRSPSSETVQMDFGGLHVSGPARTLDALKAKEEHEVKEKVEKRKVHFEDVQAIKKAAQAKEDEEARQRVVAERAKEAAEAEERKRRRAAEQDEMQRAKQAAAAAATSEETETDDDTEPAERPYPWGKRPSFRKMLAGGSKTLELLSPPSGVTNYFSDQVYRSYGCTYDNATSTFYATSPGPKGKCSGQVIAMSGECKEAPVCVTRDLLEPAAIAVYEPGLSVCVVTNRGIFVFTRQFDPQGRPTGGYLSRQISRQSYHRGIAATAGGGIVSFSNGRIRMFDGSVANGDETVITETNYDLAVNNALFLDNPPRRLERSNACFMDIVDNRLVMSDLQKHVISLWRIEESPEDKTASIHLVRAIDVGLSRDQKGKPGNISAAHIPLGKCAFASGIRLDAEGWVLCADAEGRTIQIYDKELNFVTRVVTPASLPYISGLYIEAGGHLMVCDRKSEMGGLRVYMLEAVEKTAESKKEAMGKKNKMPTFGFAAAARKQQTSAGGRF